MKKISYTLIGIIFSITGNTQISTVNLETNNVNATVRNGGVLFNNSDATAPGYEVPRSSGNAALFSTSFWFGGPDINGQLKLAATQYEEEGDFFPGALTASGAAELPVSETDSKAIYHITKAEIDNHIAHYGDVGYTVPIEIETWPAHGDVALGLDYYLAPFVDIDGNGIYEPNLGDYPLIKGDAAVYLIMNDKGNIHATGGGPIGIEIHLLIYQYETEDYLNNTTFVNARVINRSTQTIYDFKSACFADVDLGDSSDDYIGFDSTANVMYGYNGSNSDSEYGENPPAVGIVLLNHPASKFAPIFSGASAMGDPATPLDFYNYMSGNWKDGSPFTAGGTGYGGETPTNFVYNGNPTDESQWSEVSVSNIPGDRRMMMSVDLGVLTPFSEICFDYAILYNREGNNLENAAGIIELATTVKSFYDMDTEKYCEAGFSSVEELDDIIPISVYPNPANGSFSVNLTGTFDLAIFGLDGRQVFQQANVLGNDPIAVNLANGSYLISITQNNKKYQSKIVIRN